MGKSHGGSGLSDSRLLVTNQGTAGFLGTYSKHRHIPAGGVDEVGS